MATPKLLPIIGQDNPPTLTWDAFLARRHALEQQMALAVCDGCDGCGLRCTQGVSVTRAEWEAIRDYLQAQPLHERKRVLLEEKKALWPGEPVGGATMHFCRFRDREQGRCFIYPVRPTVCRLLGHTYWLPCPIEAVPLYPENAPALWNAYQALERRTLDQWYEEDSEKVLWNP